MSESGESGPGGERPHDSLASAVAQLLGRTIVRWRPVRERGYAHNERWIAYAQHGPSAFIKAAVDERTARWLRTEYLIYSTLDAPVLPSILGWHDTSELTFLVLEDLSSRILAAALGWRLNLRCSKAARSPAFADTAARLATIRGLSRHF